MNTEQSIEQRTIGDWLHGSMTDTPVSRTMKRQVLATAPVAPGDMPKVLSTDEYKQQSASWTYGLQPGHNKADQQVDTAGQPMKALD
jgi:hypothetical protein